jgi:formylglycine-generating enzyme required for sulfatase activity
MTRSTLGIILIVTLLCVLVNVAVAADTVAITARQTVVRAGPDSKQRILATVPQGTTLALLERRQGWYKVLLDDGQEGWVAQSAAQVQDGRGFTVVPAGTAAAPGRTALVIGNAAYSEDIGSLKNPGNDATDMAATLRQLGFAVTLVRDANHQRMAEAVEAFSLQLRPGSVGVFYYAGHGAQVGGRNYLIPLGARIMTEAVVPYQAVAAEEVLARMDAAGQGKSLNVMILDACRNAPFMRGWRSPLRGLAPMQATGGSLVAYATSPGAVTQDGTGRNGTYTRHLLRFMTEPNLLVELMFKQVRLAVEHETNGQQIPWELSSLRENFAFNPVAGGTTSTPVVSTPGVVTPQRPAQPGTSGGTQVAVGEYPRPSAAPKTQRNSLGMEFVLIPAGTFQMGANDSAAYGDEKPVHTVRITQPYYMGKYEVTHGQWQAVMGNNPSKFTGDSNRPVENVSWDDVQEFIRRLNAREGGATYRLPTEAEWEYAARAGTTTRWSFGDDASQLGRYVWYDGNARGQTHPVGQLQPNPWGLYDMHGNVWEWVQDWYGNYTSSTAVDPAGPSTGSLRVLRGGGWGSPARICRSALRRGGAPGFRDVYLGVRLLRVAQ